MPLMLSWLALACGPAEDEWLAVSAELVPGQALSEVELVLIHSDLPQTAGFKDKAELEGRVAAHRLLPDEPILAWRLADPGTEPGTHGMLQTGEVEVELGLQVESVLFQAGDRVDLLWTRKDLPTCPIVTAARVLGVKSKDGVVITPLPPPSRVLVLAIPESRHVAWKTAQGNGALDAMLRSPMDTKLLKLCEG